MDHNIIKGTILVRTKNILIYRVSLFFILEGDISVSWGSKVEECNPRISGHNLTTGEESQVENKLGGKQG